jgi:2-polyprenyl-3-methyl-5-hydroxy-6-metoxy-1,4-benzoquinol methylase
MHNLYLNYKTNTTENINLSNELISRKHSIIGIIDKHFPKDKSCRILDVACGYGAYLYYLNTLNFTNAFGIDLSQENIHLAKSIGVQNVMQQDLFDYLETCKQNTLDIILAIDILEHLDNQEIFKFITQAKKVLKTGASIIIHTPNANSPFFGRIRYGDFTHKTAFTPKSMKQIFRSEGLSDIICFESGPVIHGVSSFIRFVLFKISMFIFNAIILCETGMSEKILSQNFFTIIKKN